MQKYIYQTCEHHVGCNWAKPTDEANDTNANYIRHVIDNVDKIPGVKIGFN